MLWVVKITVSMRRSYIHERICLSHAHMSAIWMGSQNNRLNETFIHSWTDLFKSRPHERHLDG